MKLWEALKICCDDPIEVIGGLILLPAFIALMWIGFYLLGFN